MTLRRQKRFESPRPGRAPAPSGQRRGRRLPRRPRSRPRPLPQARRLRLDPRPAQSAASPGRPGSARAGWPARSATKPAARISPSLYHRAPRLFAALALARGDGRYAKLLRGLARVDLLILDDWGPEKLDDRAAPRPARDRRGPLRAPAPPSSPASCPSIAGTRSSAIPPSPTPSSIVSCTTPTASSSPARASANAAPQPRTMPA